MTDLSASHAAPKGGFFAAVLSALRTKRETSMTQRALYALTDRELDDIGITRGDIANIGTLTR